MDYKEFSVRIKKKYPDYNDMDDLELAKKMVAKFPEDYSDIIFPEEVTEINPQEHPMMRYTKPMGIDRFVDRNLPPIKQDLSNIGQGIKERLSNVDLEGSDIPVPPIMKAVGAWRELIKPEVLGGKDVIQALIQNPSLLKEIPSAVIESVKGDVAEIGDPNLSEYERAKAGVNVGSLAAGGVGVGGLATRGLIKGVKGVGKGFGSGIRTGLKAIDEPIDPSLVEQIPTNIESIVDKVNAPRIQNITKQLINTEQGRKALAEPREGIKQFGENFNKKYQSIKSNIINAQQNSVSDRVDSNIQRIMLENIYNDFKNENFLNPVTKTRINKEMVVGKDNILEMVDKKVTETVVPETIQDFAKAINNQKGGLPSNQPKVKTLINRLKNDTSSTKSVYEVRQIADKSINWTDNSPLNEALLIIRNRADEILRDPNFNPKAEQYARNTDNLNKMFGSKDLASLKDSSSMKFGTKFSNMDKDQQTNIRKILEQIEQPADSQWTALSNKLNKKTDTFLKDKKGALDILDFIETLKLHRTIEQKPRPEFGGKSVQSFVRKTTPSIAQKQQFGRQGKKITRRGLIGGIPTLTRLPNGELTEESKQNLFRRQE